MFYFQVLKLEVTRRIDMFLYFLLKYEILIFFEGLEFRKNAL